MSLSNELIFIPGKLKFESDNAWLLTIDDPKNTLQVRAAHGKDVWFPKSNCELQEDGLDCPQWLWDKKQDDL